VSYEILRRQHGPFWDWHYLVRGPVKNTSIPGDIATTWTLIGARIIVGRLQKQDKTIILKHVETWE
jgi:hypothetical protein